MRLLLLRLILFVCVGSFAAAQNDLSVLADLFRAADVTVDGQSYEYRLLEPLPLQRAVLSARALPLFVQA